MRHACIGKLFSIEIAKLCKFPPSTSGFCEQSRGTFIISFGTYILALFRFTIPRQFSAPGDALHQRIAQGARPDEFRRQPRHPDRLYNRAFLNDYMETAMATAKRKGEMMAVIHLDLDHFKTINDTMGMRRATPC